jgi:hypothetical protein
MTDYYPLLARAVAGLEKSTGEARRALYERARNALLDQLRNASPPLSEPEITRERLGLEEAVRKVEAEAARASRLAPRSPPPPPPPAQPSSPPPSGEGQGEPRRPFPPPPRPAPMSEGVRGIRDVIAEAENLGSATAQASRSAREAYAAVPTDTPELDRIEPRVEPERPRPSLRERLRATMPPPAPPQPEEWTPPPPPEPTYAEPEPEEETLVRRRPPGPQREIEDYEAAESGPNPARRGLIAALMTVLVITSLGAAAYWQRERISTLFGVVRGLGPQAQREQPQQRPKIEDRIGQGDAPAAQSSQTETPASTRPGAPVPQVAQRVVLYEEDPANPQGNRHVGSALWRTETVSPGPGLSPELAIRIDVEVPERRMQMTMSIRRNADPALPASHTVEIMFNLPADFPFGGVANVPGLLMKEAEQARGAPLSGLAVKVTNNFFLIGLSAVEADQQRNMQLLKERGWFDIPVVYNNGRRAILAVEKGTPGDRAFAEAFAAWKK